MSRLIREVGLAVVITLAAFTLITGLMASAVTIWLDRR